METKNEKYKEDLKKKLETLNTIISELREGEGVKESKDYEYPKLLFSRREATSSSKAEPAIFKDTSWSNFPTYKRNDFKFIRSEQKSHSDSEITNSRVNHAGRYTFVKNSSNNGSPRNSGSPRKHQSFMYKWGRTESQKAEFNNKFKYVKNGERTVPNFSLEHRKVPTRIMTYSRVFNKTEKSSEPLKNKTFQSNAYTHVPRKDAVTVSSKYKLVKDHRSAVAPKHLLKYSKKATNVSPKKIDLSKYSFERQGNTVGDTSSFIRRRYKVVKRRRSASKTINQQRTALRRAMERKLSAMNVDDNSFVLRRLLYIRKNDQRATQSLPGRSLANTRKLNTRKKTKPPKQLILSRHGSHFYVSKNFRSLRNCNLKLKSQADTRTRYKVVKRTKHKMIKRQTSITPKFNVKTIVARQLVRKNISYRKKQPKNKYCLFYSRFGKCKRGEKCKYIHDPEKIAVCTRFLRGTCKDEKCPFSHTVDPNKMPVCSYFLRGDCSKENCPYRHVKVNKDAKVCQEFLNGYCTHGEKCTLKHILECEEFAIKGTCSKGKSCKMLHRKQRRSMKRRKSSATGSRKPRAFRAKRPKLSDDIVSESSDVTISPLKDKANLLPKFISEKINEDSGVIRRPNSFSSIRNLFGSQETTSISDATSSIKMTTSDLSRQDDFIPLIASSSESEEEEAQVRQDRRFSFKEQDYISL